MPTALPAQHAAAPKPTVKNRFPRTDKYRCPAAPQHGRARFASEDSPSLASSSDAVLVAATQHGEVLHKCIALATGTAPSAHQRVHQKETRARTIRGPSRAAAVAPDRVASMRGQSTSANLDRFSQPDRPDFPGNRARQNALALGGIVNRRRHAVAECGERFRQPWNLALLMRIEKAPRLLVVDFQQSREVCGGDAPFFDPSLQRAL